MIIKLSNYPNVLIPELLQAQPDAKGIIVTNDLRSFLKAVVRKGLMGRQWGRQVCLIARGYAGNLDHLTLEALAGLTDLQLAGLGWLLTQNWFDEHLNGTYSDRLRTVHSDTFNQNRAQTIKAAARHFDLAIAPPDIAAIVEGPVFTSHAKVGGNYAAKEALDNKRSQSAVNDEEMAAVEKWIAQLADASKLTVPVPETLL